jgi:hypothetical protein
MRRWVEARGTAAALRLGDMLLAQVWEQARVEKRCEGYSGLIAMRRRFERAHLNGGR